MATHRKEFSTFCQWFYKVCAEQAVYRVLNVCQIVTKTSFCYHWWALLYCTVSRMQQYSRYSLQFAGFIFLGLGAQRGLEGINQRWFPINIVQNQPAKTLIRANVKKAAKPLSSSIAMPHFLLSEVSPTNSNEINTATNTSNLPLEYGVEPGDEGLCSGESKYQLRTYYN